VTPGDRVDGSLAELTPSILAALGVDVHSAPPAPPAPPAGALGLPLTRRACLLLVDGLGWENLAACTAQAPFMSALLPTARTLAAGFPSTTATSLTTLGTGHPPGVHGMLGYQVAVPATGQLLNCLRWQDGNGSAAAIDPLRWQPQPTVFERAAAAGIAVTKVAPGMFAGSGLSRAALRGGAHAAAETGRADRLSSRRPPQQSARLRLRILWRS
jgi:hypothetical protein